MQQAESWPRSPGIHTPLNCERRAWLRSPTESTSPRTSRPVTRSAGELPPTFSASSSATGADALPAGACLQSNGDRVERYRSEQHEPGDDVDPAVRDAQRVEPVL